MKKKSRNIKLGELQSTAICGNDIMSTVLYVSGISIGICGVYAPIILLIVGLLLFIYKGVYREVVETLPINGGAYNVLLNGTSKKVAATAGILTVLAYVATSVISSRSAVEYLTTVFDLPNLNLGFITLSPIVWISVLILLFFTFLIINGVKDSAKVATVIFGFHLITLISFVVLGFIFIATNPSQFSVNIQHTQNLFSDKSLILVLFLGFSASLLGMSGFESSANFIEEQKKGVFKKTLRNMFIGVLIFSPLVSFITLNITTVNDINTYKDYLLSNDALIIGGKFFQYVIVIDAFFVLCGAVLTSFIGVSGLINRMSLDEVLPLQLSKINTKGSFPRIIFLFSFLCISILLITGGDLLSLGGVYGISFLSVMSLFAISNIILKITRPDLKRYYKFPMFLVILAAFATMTGVVGSIILDFKNLLFFLLYFIPVFAFVRIYASRHKIMLTIHKLTKNSEKFNELTDKLLNHFTQKKYLVFIHKPNKLFEILKYINTNETGHTVILLHCKDKTDEANRETWKELKEIIPLIPKAGIFSHLHLQLEEIDGPFVPKTINLAAKKYKIAKNHIFIGSIHHEYNFDYEKVKGVRIIM